MRGRRVKDRSVRRRGEGVGRKGGQRRGGGEGDGEVNIGGGGREEEREGRERWRERRLNERAGESRKKRCEGGEGKTG